MPELPEVETTCRGITPHVQGQLVGQVIVREARLRWPVPPRLKSALPGQRIEKIFRRAKYLILQTPNGHLILHLGMSGSLRIVDANLVPDKHDHVDIVLATGKALRLRDPRRFGAVLWTTRPLEQHALLNALGPEPLSREFDGDYLFHRSRARKVNIKSFIMDSKIVVGVGNIYANEALFLAGIRPGIAAGRITRSRYQLLAEIIKSVLQKAIKAGGTTLRDFTNGEGKPGYFKQQLNVYGRAGEPCTVCATPIKLIQQGQRATYYCTQCQH